MSKKFSRSSKYKAVKVSVKGTKHAKAHKAIRYVKKAKK